METNGSEICNGMPEAVRGPRGGLRGMRSLPRGWTKKVFAWGAGEDGQLGLGTTHEEHVPKEAEILADSDIWQVVGGSRNSLAICRDGKVLTWGWNQRGTLGHPPTVKSENEPSQVEDLKGIVQAAIGGWHCLAVDEEGRAFSWGGNEYGQCAIRTEKDVGTAQQKNGWDVLRPIRCAPNLRVRQVAAGGMHSLVLTDDGQVWTWGQPLVAIDIRSERWKPVRVPGLHNVVTIASGAFHCLALLHTQEVMAWGNCEYGQLGLGDTQPKAYPEEIQELTGKNIVDIAAGGWHSLALSGEGELYAWGRGEHGRLGFGDDKSSKVSPQRVSLLEGERIVQVSGGGTHTVALSEDGRAFTFGRGDNGRLGYGSMQTTGHPREVTMGMNIDDSKHANDGHGTFHANGCAADSATVTSPPPRTPWKVTQVAAGGRHTLVLACRHTPCSSLAVEGLRKDQNEAVGYASGGESKGGDAIADAMRNCVLGNNGHARGQAAGKTGEYGAARGLCGVNGGLHSSRGGEEDERHLDVEREVTREEVVVNAAACERGVLECAAGTTGVNYESFGYRDRRAKARQAEIPAELLR